MHIPGVTINLLLGLIPHNSISLHDCPGLHMNR